MALSRLPDTALVGVLEFGETDRRVLPENLSAVIETARMLESLGYDRYWLAEHQRVNDLWLDAAPLVAALLAKTERIRIGPGGVLIRAHRPLEIASQYSLLGHLFPGRVELGISQGSASPLNYAELCDVQGEEQDGPGAVATARVRALVGYLSRYDYAGTQPYALPQPAPELPLYLLGNSVKSARFAAELSVGLAQSSFHKKSPRDVEAIAAYRSSFATNAVKPRTVLAVAEICAESPSDIENAVRIHQNFLCCDYAGTPERVSHSILSKYEAAGVDDLLILDVSATFERRRAAYAALIGFLRGR